MASSELRSFFESLSSEKAIRALTHEKVSESLYVEFKTKKDRSRPELDQSDAWQFSRALSGFANSDGGVLIWGIETNKQDEAAKLKSIAQVEEFYGRLKKSLLNSTQPVVDNVMLETISDAATLGAGYVKCLIPPSDKTPHRAMLADREYFKRTTEGFYRLEHFDLEDMFGRRPHPSLTIELALQPRSGDDPHEELHFSLINIGRGIAKYPGFLCRFDDDVKIVDARGGVQVASYLNRGAPVVSYQDNGSVIHPNSIAYSVGHAILRRERKGEGLRVQISWYCENMAARSATAEVRPEPARGATEEPAKGFSAPAA
jgi:hypothetical protein